jgi:hypothetical protein
MAAQAVTIVIFGAIALLAPPVARAEEAEEAAREEMAVEGGAGATAWTA